MSTAVENITDQEKNCTEPAINEFPEDLFTNKERKQGAVLLHIFATLYMFLALAIICDDFFVPSLEKICEKLHLNEDVAGATFMAAGSSAPELFASVIGVFITHGDVGVGTIVGSAVFNILCIIGVCGIFAGQVVILTWWPVFRDSIYYTLSVVALILFIYDDKIVWWESLILIIMYAGYIMIMKFNTRQVGRSTRAFSVTASPAIPSRELLGCRESWGDTKEDTLPYNTSTGVYCISKVTETLPNNNVNHYKRLDKGWKRGPNRCVYCFVIYRAISSSFLLHKQMSWNCHLVFDTNCFRFLFLWEPHNTASSAGLLELSKCLAVINFSPPCHSPRYPSTEQFRSALMSPEQSIHNFSFDGNSLSRTLTGSEISAGTNTAKSTDGQLDAKHDNIENGNVPEDKQGEEEESNLSSPFSVPNGCMDTTKWLISWPVLLLLYFTVPNCSKPRWEKFFMLSFSLSTLWIAIFSYIMVWMVTIIGYTLGIPDVIMGITFLAAGTSVPDCIASLIVARQGLGDMAVSNTIGSNVFDILVGLGVPWGIQTLAVNYGSEVKINSRGLVYSVVLLLGSVALTVLGIHFNKWKLDLKLGIYVLVLYAVFLCFSIMIEYNVFTFVNLPMCQEGI
uniref:Solute carrier family 24 member 4a n=1 Tax=Lepisosteus oculatus TaxID=7918 RepID=W5N9S6_LEPOC